MPRILDRSFRFPAYPHRMATVCTRSVYTILQTFGYLSLFLKLLVKSFVTFIAFLIFIISFKIYEFVRVVKEWVRSKELINYKKSRIKIYRLKKNFILYYSIKVLLF